MCYFHTLLQTSASLPSLLEHGFDASSYYTHSSFNPPTLAEHQLWARWLEKINKQRIHNPVCDSGRACAKWPASTETDDVNFAWGGWRKSHQGAGIVRWVVRDGKKSCLLSMVLLRVILVAVSSKPWKGQWVKRGRSLLCIQVKSETMFLINEWLSSTWQCRGPASFHIAAPPSAPCLSAWN